MSKKEDILTEDNTTESNNLKVNNSMSKHFSIVLQKQTLLFILSSYPFLVK